MNTPVSFPIAKLLEEKGFDKVTNKSYRISINPERPLPTEPIADEITYFPNVKESYSAPTIAEVVMWLYEKHGIWIQPFPYDTITAAKEWTATILSLEWGEDKEVHYEHKIGSLNSPTEAYEAAIEYTLKNLI